jgi:glutathione S-transferase
VSNEGTLARLPVEDRALGDAEMTIEVTAFRWVPPFAEGLVRDLRVRWALEEAGLAYHATLIGPEDQNTPRYRALQPFGQVPAYREEGLDLFESGAIVLHVGERSEVLLPRDPIGRARAIAWMFAALNSVEPHVQQLAAIDLFYTDQEWAKESRPAAVERVRSRLAVLADRLGRRDYLEDRFTAGDLLMTTVLRILRHTDLVAEYPALDAYVRRCEARPAFQKALADQLAPFAARATG